MSCNCSHCRRKGFLLTFVTIDQFRLESGADKLASYKFNKHNIDHQFCADCGCQGFSAGHGPDGSKMAAVNLRCVPEADRLGRASRRDEVCQELCILVVGVSLKTQHE